MLRIDLSSLLQTEAVMRWQMLDEEPNPCAVVTSRMELVYLNEACQAFVPVEWFAKRCFEVLPTTQALCAMDCPTIKAVQTADSVVYSEECLKADDGTTLTLGVAVIPLRDSKDDSAKSVLFFRTNDENGSDAIDRQQLLNDAIALGERIDATLA